MEALYDSSKISKSILGLPILMSKTFQLIKEKCFISMMDRNEIVQRVYGFLQVWCYYSEIY